MSRTKLTRRNHPAESRLRKEGEEGDRTNRIKREKKKTKKLHVLVEDNTQVLCSCGGQSSVMTLLAIYYEQKEVRFLIMFTQSVNIK